MHDDTKQSPRERNERKSKRKRVVHLVLVTILLLFVLLGFSIYKQNLTERLESSTKKALHEIVFQQKTSLDSAINAEIVTLKNIAASLSTFVGHDEALLELLSNVRGNTTVDHLIVAGLDGKRILHDGRRADSSDYSYFSQVLLGETMVGRPIQSTVAPIDVIPLATPIMQEGKVVGMLIGAFTVESFEQLIQPSFDGQAYSFVVDTSGGLVFGTRNEHTLLDQHNLFASWKGMTFRGQTTYEQAAAEISQAKPGAVSYGKGDEIRFAEYMPLDYNDWSIMVAVPSGIIAPDTAAIIETTSMLLFLVVFSFLILVCYILWQQRQNTRKLEKSAFYDEKTGAPTLVCFKQEAERFIQDREMKNLVMVKFDVDQFKLVNQLLGEEVGDRVLKCLVTALKENTPGRHKRYARLHDDEFLVLHEYNEQEDLLLIQERTRKAFCREMGAEFQYDVKLISGYYFMSNEKDQSISEAVEKANIAHRSAKRAKKESCCYDDELLVQSINQKEIERKMKPALENEEFRLYLQPKYRLTDETVVGAEALVRWVETNGDPIYPNHFIPAFECCGFILQLDLYMFKQVCKVLQEKIRLGWTPVPISVNFSRLHLFNPDFVSTLCEIADKYQVPHTLLEVELTESIMFDESSTLLAVLKELHAHGFVLSMDDFGAGYSSLGLLKSLPVDIIKIDRSFFAYGNEEQRGRLIIESVIQLAKKLGIYTVAEGVELQEDVDLLREIGCDIVQGFYYARPMPAEEFFQKQLTKQ